jgi:DNA-directed RNA polymerase specialized sigma24 family protein
MLIATATFNEKSLLALVAIGDRNAFLQLYTTYLNNLYRYIFQFTKSKQDTEEILQDIFIKILENESIN